MSNTQLKLKPISELRKFSFNIPSYQRGYKWGEREVLDLLNDITNFKDNDNFVRDSTYCLQPIVLLKTPNQYDLIDGQQRLTTIYLIQKYLNKLKAAERRMPAFNFTYETRANRVEFLKTLDETKKDDNSDFHHLYHAFKTISEFFEGMVDYELTEFETALQRNVKVIWYEIPKTDDPRAVFTRLNIGKIPLNNAELIKALFLRQQNYPNKSDEDVIFLQSQIANEWDLIENSLQNDELWFFLNNKETQFDTRIEFIFDLITKTHSAENPKETYKLLDTTKDKLKTFIIYNDIFKSHNDVLSHWKMVKDYFLNLQEWFENKETYHLIGFLVSQQSNVSLNKIKDASDKKNKAEFITYLRNKVYKTLPNEFGTLRYGQKGVKPILLMFNIASVLLNKGSNRRFQFNAYYLDDYEIEHIKAVKSHRPDSIGDQKKWVHTLLAYYSGNPNAKQNLIDIPEIDGIDLELYKSCVKLLLEEKYSKASFNTIYDKVLLSKNEKENETDNSIGNLTLLDAGTNRGYKNAVFPVKRKHILNLDKSGKYLPVCTRNVFLKYYSKQIDNMFFWSEQDALDHQNALVDTISTYFTNQIENVNE